MIVTAIAGHWSTDARSAPSGSTPRRISASETSASMIPSATANSGTRHAHVRTVKLPTCAVSAPQASRIRMAA